MNGITIVAAGGGLVTAYHAGVIRALKEQVDLTKIKRIVASSGAAATYSYLVSGQTELVEPIWNYLLESGCFVNPVRHKTLRGVMDIDFLVDEVIKKRFPLDLSALKASPIVFDVGVTDTETGESKFFSKNTVVDFYELIRTSCAVPYFYGKHVELAGRRYCDGTIGDVVGLNQITDADKNVLIVLTRPDRPIKKFIPVRKMLRWLLIRKEPLALQEKIWNMPKEYNRISQRIKALNNNREVCVIQPRKKLPIWRIDTSVDRLKKTIEQGYQDTINTDSLEEFWRI